MKVAREFSFTYQRAVNRVDGTRDLASSCCHMTENSPVEMLKFVHVEIRRERIRNDKNAGDLVESFLPLVAIICSQSNARLYN